MPVDKGLVTCSLSGEEDMLDTTKTTKAILNGRFGMIVFAEYDENFENEEVTHRRMKIKLILMPSSELSRAGGGFHCMSMPLLGIG